MEAIVPWSKKDMLALSAILVLAICLRLQGISNGWL